MQNNVITESEEPDKMQNLAEGNSNFNGNRNLYPTVGTNEANF